MLKLLQTLQAGKGQNADGLSAACGVSRRTLYRDLETLRDAGVPLQYDKVDKRYCIPGAFFLPPTNFTAAEALSIIALASQVGASNRLPFYEPARSAALKLESSLPPALRDELRAIIRSIQIQFNQVDPLEGKETVYQQLVDAIALRHVVKIEYESLSEWETIKTKLRPYKLLFNRHSWYAIGRSTLHAEVRTFNLSRIVHIEPTQEKYVVQRGFSLKRYLGNAWNLIPSPGRNHQIVVRFQPLVARNVSEVVWHKTQRLEHREDGCLDFHVRVSGLNEIAWWILGYGDQAEVLKPSKLRKLIANRVGNMQAIYQGTRGSRQ